MVCAQPGLCDGDRPVYEGTLVDTVTTVQGEVVTSSHTVTVSDGELTLRLFDGGGANAFVTILGLEVVENVVASGDNENNGPSLEPVVVDATPDTGSNQREGRLSGAGHEASSSTAGVDTNVRRSGKNAAVLPHDLATDIESTFGAASSSGDENDSDAAVLLSKRKQREVLPAEMVDRIFEQLADDSPLDLLLQS